jgi:dye decolorizing peroxidase
VRGDTTAPWLTGGTYLCLRKIRIDFAAWDGLTAGDQQVVIGRAKASGAPLSGGNEDAPLDLAATDGTGNLAIPADSHVRLAAPALNGGATIFRRCFSYDDGVDPATGRRDAGLLFLAHAADPTTQVVPILRSISGRDRLAQFTTHIASGVWALLPAPAAGGWLGQALFV